MNELLENNPIFLSLPEKEHAHAKKFIQLYYHNIANTDLEDLENSNLQGAALSHWSLMSQRKIGQSLIRVYNPEIEKNGWYSPHTIIEITTDDMPLLVNSINLTLKQRELEIHHFLHPILHCLRDDNHHLIQLQSPDTTSNPSDSDFIAESVMQFTIDRVNDNTTLQSIQLDIENVLSSTRRVFLDRAPIQDQLQERIGELKDQSNSQTPAELLSWLADHRFVFLAYTEFDLGSIDNQPALSLQDDKSLGLARSGYLKLGVNAKNLVPSLNDNYINSSEPINISKIAVRAPLHRDNYMDLISVTRFDSNHQVIGKSCFIGLFTSMVYNTSGADIPWIKDKIARVLNKAHLKQQSHASHALQHILETYPRDALFQTDSDTLLEISLGILQTQDREKVSLFGAVDQYSRFCDCLVYMPRDVYKKEMRVIIQKLLLEQLQGYSVEFSILFSSENTLARIHYIIQIKENSPISPDWRQIEKQIIQTTRSWNDDFKQALNKHYDNEQTRRLFTHYQLGIPDNYKADFLPSNACYDIYHLEQLKTQAITVDLYQPLSFTISQVKAKVYVRDHYIPLSDVIPVFENMGLKIDHERPYRIMTNEGDALWVHEFSSHHANNLEINPVANKDNFKQAFLKIWHKEVENDSLNRLVFDAHLNWKQIVILRTYCKYLTQIRSPFSQRYLTNCLVSNAGITEKVVALFEERFDPAKQTTDATQYQSLVELLDKKLQHVASLDEDRILRAFINLIQSTVRTNYYKQQADGSPLEYLSIKLQPSTIINMPKPHPLFDIFVYSPRVEGVHLRGGKVARGGLRWSDRREDFRTEVLGLMKAQTVKNSVIVPVGSKGGFVVKRPPEGAPREELMQEVVYCYQTFLRGLLDLTDNLQDKQLLAPENVVRHDDDDSYLVVAADKGTATFSDIANAISDEYNFWLGDAFASGGSVGYDHKKMGITARGAWESVKRHFRVKNINTQTTDFTVVGIGDMSGDVFGNGMLLSEHINLVSAFNHLHIFIDPTPDAASSFKERARLFKLDRSGWDDYNQALISKGGGIYSRSAKSIEVSPQAQQALGLSSATYSPDELIHHILQAPVDLLWNGGIGTYAKASSESHEAANDRNNDSLRVNADQLRCKVIGEGGNLGFTQLSRIEYTQNNGAMFTDAIDNSAGVDCSDHEVNIKILIKQIVQAGEITQVQRNQLLAEMTDDVAEHVLIDNYLQTQCISLVAASAPQKLEDHARFIEHLESQEGLDRALEFLPSLETIQERLGKGQGLTLPEISVIVSYAKMTLFNAVLDSETPDDPFLNKRLQRYFPPILSDRYANSITQHRLAREIIATQLVNDLVNHLGPSFVFELSDELGVCSADICKAYEVAIEIFDIQTMWQSIEALDNQVTDQTQKELQNAAQRPIELCIHWLIRTRRIEKPITEIISDFRPSMMTLMDTIATCLPDNDQQHYQLKANHFIEAGVPEALASKISMLTPLFSAMDIIEISKSLDKPLETVASIYFELGIHLNLQWLRQQINALNTGNHWHNLAKSAISNDLHYQQRHITAEVLTESDYQANPQSCVIQWSKKIPNIEQYFLLIDELKASPSFDFTMSSLALNEVHKLLQNDRPLS